MKRSLKNILTMVMIATMVLGNSFLVSAHETEQYASCSHSFENWQYYKTSTKLPPNFGDCKIRVTHYIRVCSKGGVTETKTTEYQMTHDRVRLSDGSENCRNCNMTLIPAGNN